MRGQPLQYVEQLSVGDVVFLSPAGAKAHREYNTAVGMGIGAAALAVAAPVAVGAGIGIAAAGTAVGVSSSAAGAAVGAATGSMASGFGTNPEGGSQGRIVDKKDRGFFQPGHDYEVQWEDGSKSWHLACHLFKADSSS